jgi:hypothetical protein
VFDLARLKLAVATTSLTLRGSPCAGSPTGNPLESANRTSEAKNVPLPCVNSAVACTMRTAAVRVICAARYCAGETEHKLPVPGLPTGLTGAAPTINAAESDVVPPVALVTTTECWPASAG